MVLLLAIGLGFLDRSRLFGQLVCNVPCIRQCLLFGVPLLNDMVQLRGLMWRDTVLIDVFLALSSGRILLILQVERICSGT